MDLRRLVILAGICTLSLSTSAHAGGMRIILKNGQSIAVPVDQQDIQSIVFESGPVAFSNSALASNGGTVVSGFSAWNTPRSLVIDGRAGPDDPGANSTAKDGIAAYSYGTEPFQVNFARPINIQRIGIMHKYGGGGGARHTIERARLVFSDGSSQEIRFQRTYAMQYVDVSPRMSTSVRVEPLSFYPASDSRWGVIEFEALGSP